MELFVLSIGIILIMADNQSSVETNMEHVQEFGIVIGIGREVGTCVIENDRINPNIPLVL
jgi:hypothetical protein